MSSSTPWRVLVTGAASGLGAALTAAFRARGDEVLATDLAGADLRLDITSDDDWAAALALVEERWGGLDLLVNNAGVAGGGRIDVAGLDEWEWIVEINLLGVVRGCRTFVPMFKRQRSGRIVNVASLAGPGASGGDGVVQRGQGRCRRPHRDARPRALAVRRGRRAWSVRRTSGPT